MATPRGVRTTGAIEAKRRFKRLPGVVRDAINGAVLVTTKAVQAGAKARVAVRTGRLKKSIRRRFDKSRGRGTVTATAPHAHFIELGTIHHDARPFMAPAVEAERGPHDARMRAAGRVIEREME